MDGRGCGLDATQATDALPAPINWPAADNFILEMQKRSQCECGSVEVKCQGLGSDLLERGGRSG